jgi:hypothetical protein
MSANDPGPHPEDLPWNDVPDDDALIPGAVEPDPAEVVGDETDARDLAAHDATDPNARETLDQRLAEEEPDSTVEDGAPPSVQLVDGESGEDGVELAERDPLDDDIDTDEEPPAEEAAIHISDR